MIEGKNFMGMIVEDIPKDTEYKGCNFSQRQCVDDAGTKKGVRLFPDDDSPIIFRNCNMVNCEPPPGSTVIDCNGSIMDYDVILGSETVEIDGEEIVCEMRGNRKYGNRDDDNGGYIYFPSPKEWEIEP